MGPHGNHENVNKSKGPDKSPGLWKIGRDWNTPYRDAGGLLVVFRLLLRGRQAFEAL
jgi:hypothetical protein